MKPRGTRGTCLFRLSELKFPAAVSKGTEGALGSVNKAFYSQCSTSCSINTPMEKVLVKQGCNISSPKKGTGKQGVKRLES